MKEHIVDRVVAITGAGSGFGRLLSQKCAALGARVVCADVDQSTLDETIAVINEAGGTAIGQLTDVTDATSVRRFAQRTVDTYGAIDVLVNNAGTMPLAFYRDHAEALDAWNRCIDVNIKGVLHGIVAVYDQMIEQGRGHVVNISSIYGNFPVEGAGVYGATKSAVNFLSESLRVEGQGKIKVTVVRPTGVPATNLASGIINADAIVGITGQHSTDVAAKREAALAGQLPANELDRNTIEYFNLDPDSLTDQIVYAINQPWGVSIAEVTVRASGEPFVL